MGPGSRVIVSARLAALQMQIMMMRRWMFCLKEKTINPAFSAVSHIGSPELLILIMRCYCYVQLIRICCRVISITLPLVSRGRELNMKSDTFFVPHFHISVFQWLWYGGTIIYWGDWAIPGRLLQVSQYGSNWAKRSYFSNQGFATRTGPCPAVR